MYPSIDIIDGDEDDSDGFDHHLDYHLGAHRVVFMASVLPLQPALVRR